MMASERTPVTAFVTMLIHRYGLAALAAAIAVEAAGIPVPAETALLVITAYAAHTGAFNPWAIFAVAAVAAIVGDNLGYAVGRYGGWPLLRRYKRVVHLRDEHLKVARLMFAEHGGPVVAGGRFVSVLRTTAAFLAGVNKMPWGRFLVFNALGAIAWAGSVDDHRHRRGPSGRGQRGRREVRDRRRGHPLRGRTVPVGPPALGRSRGARGGRVPRTPVKE